MLQAKPALIVPAHQLVTSVQELALDASAFNSVARNNRRIEEGTTEDIRSPLFGKHSDEEILDAWDAVFQAQSGKLRPTLQKMEESNRSKFGPRSIAKPWIERKLSTYGYFDQRDGRGLPQVDGEARLRRLALQRAVTTLIPSTSTGLPFMRKKRDVLDVILTNYEELLSRLDPCVLFTRTQEGGKTRDVWGQPVVETLFEQTFFQPLLPLRKRLPERSALVGPDAVERDMLRVLSIARLRMKPVLSIDFSSYDASLKPRLTVPALRGLLSNFQGEEEAKERLISRFTTIGLVTPSGVWHGEHGVPSGSVFTNECDSEVQLRIAQACGSVYASAVQGDDGVHVCDDPQGLESEFEAYGLTVNRDKGHKSDVEAIYLQNFFHVDDLNPRRDGLAGMYPTYRALNRIVHMERWTDLDEGLSGDDFFAIRSITILENCKRHPYFRPFVEFVARNDRNNLNFSDRGLATYARSVLSKGKAGIQHSWSEQIAGIRSFETVKVLKGM